MSLPPSKNPPAVHIAVVNWNSGENVLTCLRYVDRLAYPDRRVTVVDNASVDGSAEVVSAARPDIRVMEAGENLGYGGGNNLVIEEALREGASYVWILNPDVTFDRDTLSVLVDAMEHDPQIGLLSPTVIHPDTGLPEALNRFAPFASQPALARELSGQVQGDIMYVDCAPGCSILIRLEAVRETGSFDARYFHFWEDVDLCWRMWDAGWKVGQSRACNVFHRAGSSTRNQDALSMYYMLRNLVLFAASARGVTPALAVLAPPVARQCVACLFGIRTLFRPSVKGAIVRALRDVLMRRLGRSRYYSPS